MEAAASFFDMYFGDMFAVQILCQALSLVYVATPFSRDLRSVLRFLAELVCVFAVYSLLYLCADLAFFYLGGSSSILMLFVDIVISLAYISLFHRGDFSRKLILAAVVVTVNWQVLNGMSALGMLNQWANFYLWLDIVLRVTKYVLLLLTAALLRRFSLDRFVPLPKRGVCLVAAVYYLILAFEIVLTLTEYSDAFLSLPWTVYAFMLAVSVLLYAVLYLLCDGYSRAIDTEIENERLRANIECRQVNDSQMLELQKLRHDMRNHASYMGALIAAGEYGRLSEYFSGISESLDGYASCVDSGNRAVDSVLNMEIAKAKPHGFSFRTELVVPPVLPIRDDHLCSLLSNMCDNAIEANLRYGVTEDILVSVYPRKDYLYVGVCNRIPEGADVSALFSGSSKREGGHGLGMRIMESVCGRYGGYLCCRAENGTVCVETLLEIAPCAQGEGAEKAARGRG